MPKFVVIVVNQCVHIKIQKNNLMFSSFRKDHEMIHSVIIPVYSATLKMTEYTGCLFLR